MIVLNEGPASIQSACQRVMTLIANKRVVYGSKVSFQERAFTLEEERKVSNIEKSLDAIQLMLRGSTPSPSRQYRPRFRDPGYYPNASRYNMDNRGRSVTRGQYPYGQNFANT